jgi:hypothetical protein
VEGEAEGRAAVAEDIARSSAETEARLEELRSQLEGFRQQADEHCGRVERQVGLGLLLALTRQSWERSWDSPCLARETTRSVKKERAPYVVKDVEGVGGGGMGLRKSGVQVGNAMGVMGVACPAFRAW